MLPLTCDTPCWDDCVVICLTVSICPRNACSFQVPGVLQSGQSETRLPTSSWIFSSTSHIIPHISQPNSGTVLNLGLMSNDTSIPKTVRCCMIKSEEVGIEDQ
jgi:hypothetical protein